MTVKMKKFLWKKRISGCMVFGGMKYALGEDASVGVKGDLC